MGDSWREVKRRVVDDTRRLLHHSHLTAKEIAERAGFWDRGHFSRVFRRLRGMGPAEFRKAGVGGP
jgi:AraC-like DNA-binding protein